MASIQFYPYKKKPNSKIYVRVSIGRNHDYRLSTGLSIDSPADWSNSRNLPKRNSQRNKDIADKLESLKGFLNQQIELIKMDENQSTSDIHSSFIKSKINEFFNELPEEDKNSIKAFCGVFISELNKPQLQYGKPKNLKQGTIDKYKNFIGQLLNFMEHKNTDYKIKEIDTNFAKELAEFLYETKSLSVNTVGRYLKRLKTIIRKAETMGYAVNKDYMNIKGYEDQTIVTFLTLEELSQIKDAEMPNSDLVVAKDWLLIGCFTGQRISDLFRMRKSNILKIDNFEYIQIKQFKTNKLVTIPIHPIVKDILNKYDGDFPPNFYAKEKSNRTKLSAKMKEVCRISGITQEVNGRYNGTIGMYPKYKLIQNHSCRRSFCCNFHGKEGFTVPMIMAITGHEKETNFYKYIDKTDITLSRMMAEQFNSQ